MVKIRQGMFETNSSSTHTIIVTEQRTEPGLHVDFAMGDFGWKFEKLDTVDKKASYLYTLACCILNRDVFQELYEILVKYGVEATCSVPLQFDQYGPCNGYVDHDYCGDTIDFVERMLNHEHALIKYLFSDESFVITGNDNCDDDEYEWMEKQTNVDYPHTTYYKGN